MPENASSGNPEDSVGGSVGKNARGSLGGSEWDSAGDSVGGNEGADEAGSRMVSNSGFLSSQSLASVSTSPPSCFSASRGCDRTDPEANHHTIYCTTMVQLIRKLQQCMKTEK